MEPRYVINRSFVDETTKCMYDFKCLHEEYPTCGEVMKGVENVLCSLPTSLFCYYRVPLNIETPSCCCPVRGEIYRKYKEITD
jgi:hypothetical protein